MSDKPSDPAEPGGRAPEAPPAPRRKRRWLRWVLRGLLGLVLLIVLLVAGALIYVQTAPGSARVLALALRAANESLAGKLTVGGLELHGGHIVLRDVTLLDPEGERVAHVDLLEVRAALLPLIGKTVHLQVVRIEHPEVWLEIDDRGMNLTRAIAARNPKPPEPSSGPLPFTFVVDRFTLERGAVRVVQGSGEEARRVALTGLALDSPAAMRGRPARSRASSRAAARSRGFSTDRSGWRSRARATTGPGKHRWT